MLRQDVKQTSHDLKELKKTLYNELKLRGSSSLISKLDLLFKRIEGESNHANSISTLDVIEKISHRLFNKKQTVEKIDSKSKIAIYRIKNHKFAISAEFLAAILKDLKLNEIQGGLFSCVACIQDRIVPMIYQSDNPKSFKDFSGSFLLFHQLGRSFGVLADEVISIEEVDSGKLFHNSGVGLIKGIVEVHDQQYINVVDDRKLFSCC